MISRFLIKVVLVIVVVGGAIVEFGSPLVVRAQLDGVANDAADESAFALAQSRNAVLAQSTAEQIIAGRDASLRSFQIDSAGAVNVTVAREAPSLILKKWGKVKSWYDVVVNASAARRGP